MKIRIVSFDDLLRAFFKGVNDMLTVTSAHRIYVVCQAFDFRMGDRWLYDHIRKANSFLMTTKDHERGFGGETGIRTLGRLPFNGFQDRRIRPLCHLSVTDFIISQMGLQQIFMVLLHNVNERRISLIDCLLFDTTRCFTEVKA